jgi:hypothetical protein
MFRTVCEIEIFDCSKVVDKKDILRTVFNRGIYCSRDKLVQFTYYNTFSKIPPSLCNSCQDMACCSLYSVQCTVYCTVK